MQGDGHNLRPAKALDEVRAKVAAGYYSAPGIALKTAELILKNHPRMFAGPGKHTSPAANDPSRHTCTE